MNFGEALGMMREGNKVARRHWVATFIYLVHANRRQTQTLAEKAYFGEYTQVAYTPHFVFKGSDDKLSTWQPTTDDCLAVDWVYVP